MSAYPDFLNTDTATAPACRGADTNLFFPEQGQDPTEAKRICRGCPLLARCRRWALAQPVIDLHGVWGGLSLHERMDIKRERIQRRGRRGPGDYHDVIVRMRDQNATWAAIAKAIGYTENGVKSYWKRQRRNHELAREQVAA